MSFTTSNFEVSNDVTPRLMTQIRYKKIGAGALEKLQSPHSTINGNVKISKPENGYFLNLNDRKRNTVNR